MPLSLCVHISFAFPLSSLGLGRLMLWSLGSSRGPLSRVDIGLSSNISVSLSSSSSAMSVDSSPSGVGVEDFFGAYQEADSLKTTSRLVRACRVIGL